jgi:hypothetical protein
MEKKRPGRTRERILETSLASSIATAFRMSPPRTSPGRAHGPGNLYYHFSNKDEIVNELAAAFENCTALRRPARPPTHCRRSLALATSSSKRCGRTHFLYHDLDLLTARIARSLPSPR